MLEDVPLFLVVKYGRIWKNMGFFQGRSAKENENFQRGTSSKSTNSRVESSSFGYKKAAFNGC
jgi:hypothetical protein